MNNTFQTVFEVSYSSNGKLILGLTILAISIIMEIYLRLEKKYRPQEYSLVFHVLILIAWFPLAILIFTGIGNAGLNYTKALNNGDCEITEGIVHVLHYEPYGGHDPEGERISVSGQEFNYSYYEGAGLAYHNTFAHNGVLVEGAKVRVFHLKGKILKIELDKSNN
jgi:hypothetical protein